MVDVRCFDDLDEFGRDLDDPDEELVQDVIHQLLETYGSNPDAPTRSIDLEGALSGPLDPGLAHRIETKLTEDDRIDAAKVTFAATEESRVRVDLAITSNGAALGIALVQGPDGKLVRVPS